MCDLNLRISFPISVLYVVVSPKVANATKISNTSKISVAIENIFEKNSKKVYSLVKQVEQTLSLIAFLD